MGQVLQPITPNTFIRIEIYGTQMVIPSAYVHHFCYPNCFPNLIPGEIAYGTAQEQIAQAYLLRWYLTPRGSADLFLDIGCSCGVYGLLALQRGFNVVGFDAIAQLCELFDQNLNDSVKAKAINVILTDDESQPLFIGKWETNQIQVVSQETEGLTERVESRRLDGFDLTNVHAVKIDVEGMAGEVLRGGEQTLRQANVLLVEIHNPDEFRETVHFIQKFGMKSQIITESHILAVKSHLLLPQEYEEGQC